MKRHPEVQELVEDHLSRGAPKDVGLAGVVSGLAAIGAVLGDVQEGRGNWAALVEQLRRGEREARAGLELGAGDARVAALRPYVDRQLAFASLLADEILRVTAGGDNAGVSVTPRARITFHVRAFPGWERLRTELAAALGVPVAEVRGLTEPADPAVRLDANARVMGFQLTVDLFIDPVRMRPPPLAELAARLARQLDLDIAYHDGGPVPFEYVLQRPNGQRLVAIERADEESDGLLLDEAPANLRSLS